MDNKNIQIVGEPVNQHGPYTFYKTFKYLTKTGDYKTVSISEFFFVKIWSDSDLINIGELQLLWEDKNSEQILSSLRLYFLPENTPDGRCDDHGEDEVVAITEKVVLRVEDLVTWLLPDGGARDWRWGHQVATTALKQENSLMKTENGSTESVMVLSFPRYCRYRSMARRLESAPDPLFQSSLVAALGGVLGSNTPTRVLFCKDTFDYPELETHEMLCNHLTPKLAGRPRKKQRKKRGSSPGSESNESEISSFSAESGNGIKATKSQVGLLNRPGPSRTARMGSSGGRIISRQPGSRQEQEFLRDLYTFMEKHQSPIDRIPSLGFKQIDLYAFYQKVLSLGGYQHVTTRKMWKTVYDELGGSQSNTSAATCTRRHYERLLLGFEKCQLNQGSSTSRLGASKKPKMGRKPVLLPLPPPPVSTIVKPEPTPNITIEEVKTVPASLCRAPRPESPANKKRKLEILQQGGLEVTPVGAANHPPRSSPPPARLNRQISITVTPDVGPMLVPPPQQRHMFSRTGLVYGNPKVLPTYQEKTELGVLDLSAKSTMSRQHNGHHVASATSKAVVTVERPNLNSSLEITLVNSPEHNNGKTNRTGSSSLKRHRNHTHVPNHHQNHHPQPPTPPTPNPHPHQLLQQQQQQHLLQQQHQHHFQQQQQLLHQQLMKQQPTNNNNKMIAAAQGSPYLPMFDPAYYAALYNSHLFRGAMSQPEIYKNLLLSQSPLLAAFSPNFPGLPRDGSTSITPLPRPQ